MLQPAPMNTQPGSYHVAAQTRAQPSTRRHNGPDGSARVIVRNTLIQVSDDAGAEAADSATVLIVAPAALAGAGDDATKGSVETATVTAATTGDT